MPNRPIAEIFPIIHLHHFMTSDSVITINSSEVEDRLSTVHIVEQALVFLVVIGNRLPVKPAAHQ
jgi:hypothetical protein